MPVGKVASHAFDVGNRHILKFSELFEGVEENGCPRYGIGLFETGLSHIFRLIR